MRLALPLRAAAADMRHRGVPVSRNVLSGAGRVFRVAFVYNCSGKWRRPRVAAAGVCAGKTTFAVFNRALRFIGRAFSRTFK
jgi:hypothetical protein